jgi:hypothetical protein
MGLVSYLKSILRPRAEKTSTPSASQTVGNHRKDTVFDLDEWVRTQTASYGVRDGLNAVLSERARNFNRELQGICGPLLDDLLNTSPLMIPCDFWGADLGWRSERRRKRWEALLTRNGIVISQEQTGLLVKFYMNAAEWVPHPYALPHWALSDFKLFSEYVVPSSDAFELCRKWRIENSIALTRKLSERLKGHGVALGASYRSYERTDYAEVGLMYPHGSSALVVTTVWKGETALAQLVRGVFPDACREYSPQWLGGLRLDVYVPSRQIAFEYQGEQHYAPVEYFGGKKGHRASRERDIRKKEACRKAGVLLIEWKHDERISMDQLITRLRKVGIELPLVT